MTREETITIIDNLHLIGCGRNQHEDDLKINKALDMAIEALKQPFDEMQLLNDGTLKVRVANVLDIKRVMVMDDNVIYDSYYPDRPKGEWLEVEDCVGDVHYKCNQCGAEWTFPCGTPEENNAHYCPCCGADMRVGVM